MPTSHERVSRALDQLTSGLVPFVEDAIRTVSKDRWKETARNSFRSGRGQGLGSGAELRWDAHTVLTVMWDQWNSIFRHKLGQHVRSLVSELREFRNRWAHQESFNFDDTYRILDSSERLLRAVEAIEAEHVSVEKREVMQDQFSQLLEEAAYESNQSRMMRQDIVVLSTCCIVIAGAFLMEFGPALWYLSAFVVVAFGYLIYKRARTQQPRFGPHECQRCRKIVYTAACPYCETTRLRIEEMQAETLDENDSDDE